MLRLLVKVFQISLYIHIHIFPLNYDYTLPIVYQNVIVNQQYNAKITLYLFVYFENYSLFLNVVLHNPFKGSYLFHFRRNLHNLQKQLILLSSKDFCLFRLYKILPILLRNTIATDTPLSTINYWLLINSHTPHTVPVLFH